MKIRVKIENMLWYITKRRVVKELNKIRWQKPSKNQFSIEEAYWRKDRGVLRNDFEGIINQGEFPYPKGWILKLYCFFRPEYFRTFNAKFSSILNECIHDGYIRPENISCEERLVVTGKGEKLISFFYYLRAFFENAYIKAIIIAVITLFVTWYITNNILTILEAKKTL